jgi:hypothetical protein
MCVFVSEDLLGRVAELRDELVIHHHDAAAPITKMGAAKQDWEGRVGTLPP